MSYHNSVLLKESVEALDVKEGGVYVDVTFGGGGHSREILSRLGSSGRLFAFDQDPDAVGNLIDDPRFVLIRENFRYISRFLRFYGVKEVDGILADLGVSSHQFDQKHRGFSIRFDADLDMRMSKVSGLTAREVVNSYGQQHLANIFYVYGELRNANALAREIVEARAVDEIVTTFQLKQVLRRHLPKAKENRFLAQLFQALRIEVNQELQVLKEFLTQVPDLLSSRGRLSVISYHSLEDRLVKRFVQSGNFKGELVKDFYGNIQRPLKKVGKMLIPTEEEIKVNNRSRSAKLRVSKLNNE